MSDNNTQLISRKRHYFYVMLFSVFVFLALSLLASIFFPHYRDPYDVGKPYNINLLWFVPAGLFFGFLFGLVINRWMLVIYSKGPADEVPVSFAARAGRFIRGWRFPLYIVMIAGLYVIALSVKQRYYFSVSNHKIPGLDVRQSEEIRRWTLRYITQNPRPEYIIQLAELEYTDNDSWIRKYIKRAILKHDNKETVELLLKILLEDDDPRVRLYAARALFDFENRETMPVLFEAFKKEKDIETRRMIDACLSYVGNSSLTYPLVLELKNNEWDVVRSQAANLLCSFGNEDAVQPVLDAVQNDESENVRAWAGFSLKYFGYRNISVTVPVEPMLEILENGENEFNRMIAASALWRNKNPRVIEPLIYALENDKSKHVRFSAACSLHNIGGEKALKAIEKAIKNDPEQYVREAAEQYLRYAKEAEKEKRKQENKATGK
ncbi:MAG: HEAT repeat domain-containing protein [Planctomycetota bacterium]|nr:MAG: HEAT repeat domain-containing protein [Planctomycetota bacterium]